MKKIILSILVILLLVGGFFAWKLFGPTVKQPESKYFFVYTGSDYEKVKNDLEEQKIVGSPWAFELASRIVGYKKVKPGRYEIGRGMSVVNLVRLLNNAQQTPVSFVITKIRTKEVLASRIGKAFECDSVDVISFLNNPDSLKPFGLDTNTVMSAAMPYTYSVRWNSTAGRVFKEFFEAYEKFWTEDRKAKAKNLGLTQTEVVTIASIIDEETNAEVDRPKIASVYLNRIAIGMPLQADPTLKFALKEFGIKRILSKHTEVVSPYNTYKNRGLPPGPICTPATVTIDAVLDAPKTDYLYFVANSDFSNTHVFTTDYNDHMKYARLYQQELNKRNVR